MFNIKSTDMKRTNIALAACALMLGFTACEDQLDVKNPNYQTTADFGDNEAELQEAVIACYNRIRLEGTFARVGYTMDAVRGDEVWNASQVWYLPFDNLNVGAGDEIGQWIWRDSYHGVNRANFVLKYVESAKLSAEAYRQIKGQALFIRALMNFHLSAYFQNVPLYTSYDAYATLEGTYAKNASQDEVFDLIESDLAEAMAILPSRDKGGEWAQGRATCGAAAGFYARALMFRHKFNEAYAVLKDIIAGKYGHYELMADYGDNCREGASENNAESLFEVQFLDYGKQGTEAEWTPVNMTKDATQGHAVESNYASYVFNSWADLAGAEWLYNEFKRERTTDDRLDPRLYWTLVSYEKEYDNYTGVKTAAYPNGDPRCNTVYQTDITETPAVNAGALGSISIAKNTNARANLYNKIATGLSCGVNLRLMRYSDVLLRAAECENEINGPTQTAIDYINQVRRRATLADLQLADFPSADALFEQIANVERPKEFGCEYGRGIDLIRWGFFYDASRRQQLTEHTTYSYKNSAEGETITKCSMDNYIPGHEYFPIYQNTLDQNKNLVGNSANSETEKDNSGDFQSHGYKVHPVVK